VDAFLESWAENNNATDVGKAPAESVDTGNERLKSAFGELQGTVSTSQGTAHIGVASFVTVNDDGLAAQTVLLYDVESSDLDALGKEFGAMTSSMWQGMLE
jgi:hypothetical protein